MNTVVEPDKIWKPKDYEQVVCLQRNWLEANLGRFSGFHGSPGFPDLLRRNSRPGDNWNFFERGLCETDSDLKQLIPYMIVLDIAVTAVPRVLTYRRTPQAGEQRLHGKRSIGFGGHLGPADGQVLPEILQTGAKRELREEIRFPSECRVRQLGLLNDDSTEVGRVHLGVVLVVELLTDGIAATKIADELDDVTFVPVTTLFKCYNGDIHDEFEDWSKILLTCHAIVRDNEIMEGPVLWRSSFLEK